jgi:hypothetical protein
VKLLLDRMLTSSLEIGMAGLSRIPLSRAAEEGREAVVKLLFD